MISLCLSVVSLYSLIVLVFLRADQMEMRMVALLELLKVEREQKAEFVRFPPPPRLGHLDDVIVFLGGRRSRERRGSSSVARPPSRALAHQQIFAQPRLYAGRERRGDRHSDQEERGVGGACEEARRTNADGSPHGSSRCSWRAIGSAPSYCPRRPPRCSREPRSCNWSIWSEVYATLISSDDRLLISHLLLVPHWSCSTRKRRFRDWSSKSNASRRLYLPFHFHPFFPL